MALPARDHRITVDHAAELTKRFRASAPKGELLAGTFHAMQVLELLQQNDCVALRVYHGLDDTGESTLVLVGVDDTDQDMAKGMILQLPYRCPPICGVSSPLGP